MKTASQKPPTLLNVLEEKDNSIGDKVNKKNRNCAIQCLDACKCLEHEKIAKGYIWVTNGKTSKLIHPDKLESSFVDGFSKSKK